MALLARHCADPELRALWGELLASEARHFGLYWLLAERRFPRPLLLSRLGELAAAEHALLATPADAIPRVRMHATGVETVETDPTPAGR